MQIVLSSIPAEGKKFRVSSADKEIQQVLEEFIGDAEFNAEFSIFPTGNSYQISGVVSSKPRLACSFCGEEVQLQLCEKFDEALLTGLCKELHKTSSKKDQIELQNDIAPGLSENHLTVGAFLREFVGLSIPYQVKCDLGENGGCLNLDSDANKHNSSEHKGHPAFQSLKKLKIEQN